MHKVWIQVRSSLWFVPTLLVLAGIALGLFLVQVDIWYGSDWKIHKQHPFFGAGAEGSRGMLAAIAGSVITVAGVAFSVTIVTLSLASTQYTPRIVRIFMGDRWNQFVLGSFVGIFAYCLIVMRTIRTGSEDEASFVPLIAVFFGMLLALLSIACLIFFIHHTASSIQASSILAAINQETIAAIDRVRPEENGDDEPADASAGEGIVGPWHPIVARSTGYLQSVDLRALLQFACRQKTIVRIEHAVGDFVIKDSTVAACGRPLDKDEAQELRASIVVGEFRDINQDPGFGIRQIVDIAMKALSPGVNDTSTAVSCLDYLSAILSVLVVRRAGSPYRIDDAGTVRVISPASDFEHLVAKSMDEIRLSADGNVTILLQMLRALAQVAEIAPPGRKPPLLRHARLIANSADRTVVEPYDRQRINERLACILPLLEANPGELPPIRPEQEVKPAPRST
ncbi:MAG: DUF2254 domain-containing protein [Chthoniobacterales bacterium]|nr:DUF2254 domain-containing protein [Chthoniobacterales bacterium]